MIHDWQNRINVYVNIGLKVQQLLETIQLSFTQLIVVNYVFFFFSITKKSTSNVNCILIVLGLIVREWWTLLRSQIKSTQIIDWFLRRYENCSTPIKTSQNRVDNQQTQPTCTYRRMSMVEHWAAMQEVMSLTPARPTLGVLKMTEEKVLPS